MQFFTTEKLCIVQVLAVSRKAIFVAVLYVQNILQYNVRYCRPIVVMKWQNNHE